MPSGRGGGFVLYSEFLLGLSNGPPEAASVPAGKDAEDTVRAACNRMRSDLSLQERYIELASRWKKPSLERDYG